MLLAHKEGIVFVAKQMLVFVPLVFSHRCPDLPSCSVSVTDTVGNMRVTRSWTPHRRGCVSARGDELDHVCPTGAIWKLVLTQRCPVSKTVIQVLH